MVPDREKEYIRDLAKKQLDLAKSPLMEERKNLWLDHNEGKGQRPMVAMDEWHFFKEMCPEQRCSDALAREIEEQLVNQVMRVELIGDDKVTPDFYRLEYGVAGPRGGLGQKSVGAEAGLGYHIIPQIEVIEKDFEKLSPTEYYYDKSGVERKKEQIEEIIGGILPVKAVNASNKWGPSPMREVIGLMGMENAYCSMVTEPDQFHRLMEFLTEDIIRQYRYEEENSCMDLNNGNDYTGSGNWCFSRELPGRDYDGHVRSTDTWGHLNAEDSAEISPEMFKEFVLPYQRRLAKEFGLVYYGCCEAVSRFWEEGVDEIKNIRKVSISNWCDEAFMGERLAGKRIIYSRKPSANYLGVEKNFDEDAFRKYIQKTVGCTKGCKTEYIFRDVITLNGNIEKVRRAVEIVREETEDSY